MKNKIIKLIPYYLFISGGLGVFLVIYLFFKINITKYEEVIIITIPGFIYLHSIYTAILIKRKNLYLKQNIIINQILQSLSIKFLGFKYLVSSGIYLFIGLDVTNDIISKSKIGINPIFEIGIRGDKDNIYIGINLIALIIVYLYLKEDH